MDDKLEEVHEELLAWAETLGVEVKNVRPMRLSGRGFGGQLFIVFPSNVSGHTPLKIVHCRQFHSDGS